MADDKLRRFRLATAKRLRANQTSAELRLWRAIYRVPLLQTHFRRQAPIGPYVVDFACLRAKLLIEIDGPSHTEEGAADRDPARTAWLEREGYRVIRFWNAEVFDNLDGVLDTIYAALYGSLDKDPGVSPHPGRLRRPTLPLQGRVSSPDVARAPSPRGGGSPRSGGVG